MRGGDRGAVPDGLRGVVVGAGGRVVRAVDLGMLVWWGGRLGIGKEGCFTASMAVFTRSCLMRPCRERLLTRALFVEPDESQAILRDRGDGWTLKRRRVVDCRAGATAMRWQRDDGPQAADVSSACRLNGLGFPSRFFVGCDFLKQSL